MFFSPIMTINLPLQENTKSYGSSTGFTCRPLFGSSVEAATGTTISAAPAMSNNTRKTERAVLPSLPELQKKPLNPQTDPGPTKSSNKDLSFGMPSEVPRIYCMTSDLLNFSWMF